MNDCMSLCDRKLEPQEYSVKMANQARNNVWTIRISRHRPKDVKILIRIK